MAYVLRADVLGKMDLKELILLTNNDPNANSVDYTKVDAILTFINSLVDDALRGHYTLPLEASVAVVINEIALNLTIYKINELRKRNQMPDGMKDLWKSNLDLLKDYQEGRKTLNVGTAESRPSFIKINERTKIFDFT